MTEKPVHRARITLRQLEIFAVTASAGSTRAAADRVARSQSATSTALVELESALGVQLFDRVGRRLVLNENGRLLLPHASSLVERASEVESLFETGQVRQLRLAASFTIGEYLLPQQVSLWKQRHPQGTVRLDISNSRAVMEAVAGLSVDLGFIEGSHTHPELQVEHWMDDEMVVIAAPTHPLAHQQVSNAQLAAAGWVMREAGSGTREAADRLLVPHLRRVTVAMELGSNEAVKRAVAAGLELGCLSRLAVQAALEERSLVALRTRLPRMRRSLAIVMHKAKALGTAAQGFVAQCRSAARS